MQYQVKNLAGNHQKKGRYLMDYSRKYQPPYDVAEKARQHMLAWSKARSRVTKPDPGTKSDIGTKSKSGIESDTRTELDKNRT